MRIKLFQNFLFMLIILSLICSGPTVAWAKISMKNESELGEMVHTRISAANVLFDDPVVNQYYNRVAQKLYKAAGQQQFLYKFSIINSGGINAFAVPGGYIYMHTETLISLETEGQLASILAHEIAHIDGRHFIKRMDESKTTSLLTLAAILAGGFLASRGGENSGEAWPFIIAGATGASQQAMLANSRSQETDADIKGRKILVKAGYKAGDMYAAFKILKEKTYQLSRGIPTYLSTHPDLDYRLATNFKGLEGGVTLPDPNYQAIRDRVLALSGESRRVQTTMNKRLESNPNDASAIHALGLLAARSQNYKQADKLMRQALGLSPNNPEYLGDLGDLALKRRKTEEAKDYYLKASKFGKNQQVLLGLARSYELSGDQRKAATYYDELINNTNDSFAEGFDMAGRFFGKNGQMTKGHYCMAKGLAAKGDLERAIYHYQEVVKAPDAGAYKKIALNALARLEPLEKELKPMNKKR